MLKLEFKNHSRSPVWVVDKTFSIGSGEENQIVIDDASVSPQHARIVREESGYWIRHIGDFGCVYVNQQRANRKSLHDGDSITIGEVELLVVDPFLTPRTADTWSLIACSGLLSGQEFPVPAQARTRAIVIGRGRECDMTFPGAHLSREHVQLSIEGDQLRVKDLNSANGTFINDARSEEGIVFTGDRLRLDVYSFIVFGPSRRTAPESADDTYAIIPAQTVDHAVAPKIDEPLRQWVTRPTSPGNRDPAIKSKSQNRAIVLIAVTLCIAVVGLGFYLTFG